MGYKHLLGWPITFDDLEAQDEEYYSALKKITTMDDPSMMCLDFTVTEDNLGDRMDIPLIPGGETMEVTSESLSEYLEANLKYRMLNRCKPQITELMLGFFDIIPEPALTIFDPNELELILCGLPTIDMNDWMDNSKYSGYFESRGKGHQECPHGDSLCFRATTGISRGFAYTASLVTNTSTQGPTHVSTALTCQTIPPSAN